MSEAANRPRVKLAAFLCRPEANGTHAEPPDTSFDETSVPKIELTADALAEAFAPPPPPPYQPSPETAAPALSQTQVSVFGTFAAMTLCAIALVVAKAFGFWGVMTMANAWLVAVAAARIMRWTHLLGMPLPAWTWLELGSFGLALAAFQMLAAPRG